jgi:methylmalonyl-CoA mutase cobalamin-binding subunit
MEMETELLRRKMNALLSGWEKEGMPTRTGFQEAAEKLIRWRKKNGVPGLWEPPPLFVTATIDDGWGHGLQLIELWGKAAGLKVHSMGLLRKPAEIARKCRQLNPDLLGMTVLQFDSEDDIAQITANLPPKTILIAGGPVFKPDPELAGRAGIHVVAENAAAFVAFLLKWKPGGR